MRREEGKKENSSLPHVSPQSQVDSHPSVGLLDTPSATTQAEQGLAYAQRLRRLRCLEINGQLRNRKRDVYIRAVCFLAKGDISKVIRLLRVFCVVECKDFFQQIRYFACELVGWCLRHPGQDRLVRQLVLAGIEVAVSQRLGPGPMFPNSVRRETTHKETPETIFVVTIPPLPPCTLPIGQVESPKRANHTITS